MTGIFQTTTTTTMMMMMMQQVVQLVRFLSSYFFSQKAMTCSFGCNVAVQISPLCNRIDDIYWISGYHTEGIASRLTL
jgi:hypothetical protein